jgi:hypothetical protein
LQNLQNFYPRRKWAGILRNLALQAQILLRRRTRVTNYGVLNFLARSVARLFTRRQVRRNEPVIHVGADDAAQNWAYNRNPPIAIGEQVRCSSDQAEEAQTQVAGRVDSISAGAAQR